jgi:GNAT superfamily N-acetyltransferase
MPESAGTNRETESAALVAESPKELEFDLESVHIEPIAKKHKRSAFVCTNGTIQNYCRNNARQHNDDYMVRAFVACSGDSPEVLGYYYLALTSYKIGDSDNRLDDRSDVKFDRSKAVPAVYLGMIGVHTDYQGKGIGSLLMMDAIQRTAKISQHAGLYALALDAVDEAVAAYYSGKFGFKSFKGSTTGLEMFLPILEILAALPRGTA